MERHALERRLDEGASDPHKGEIGLRLLFIGHAGSAFGVGNGLAFKNRSKLSECAFSLVDLPKQVSVADFAQQRPRSYLVCPVGLFS